MLVQTRFETPVLGSLIEGGFTLEQLLTVCLILPHLTDSSSLQRSVLRDVITGESYYRNRVVPLRRDGLA